MQAHHVFESPERFVVGTVGEPGQREFYLQARGDGTAVTVAVEKAEVAALAEGLSHLMFEIKRSGGPTPVRPDASPDRAPLEAVGGEVSPDFVLNRLTVAWDGESVVIEAASTEPATGPDDIFGEPVSDEDAADAAAVLAELDAGFDDVDPEELAELDQPIASLRVRLSLEQAASFITRANDVVGAGRQALLKPCVLCGQLVDAGGARLRPSQLGVRAWLDLRSGASGDMLLGALLDAGAPLTDVQSCIAALGVPVSISTSPVVKHGVVASQLSVTVGEVQPHRTWYDVKALLGAAELPDAVRAASLAVFAVLAEAEGLAHGTTPDEVHFHEVGAHDAIADIVGVCAAFVALAIEEVTATPVALGGGTVRSAHGLLAVPVPAVVQIAALGDLETVPGPVEVELCTPTGAALLSHWVTRWSAEAPTAVVTTGIGAGTRDLPDQANVLRMLLFS